jgi:hypothetical protein
MNKHKTNSCIQSTLLLVLASTPGYFSIILGFDLKKWHATLENIWRNKNTLKKKQAILEIKNLETL